MKLAVPDKISPSYFVAEAAVELGFFKAEGLDVSLELVYPVDKAYEALRDGKIDFVGGAAHGALASTTPGDTSMATRKEVSNWRVEASLPQTYSVRSGSSHAIPSVL